MQKAFYNGEQKAPGLVEPKAADAAYPLGGELLSPQQATDTNIQKINMFQ